MLHTRSCVHGFCQILVSQSQSWPLISLSPYSSFLIEDLSDGSLDERDSGSFYLCVVFSSVDKFITLVLEIHTQCISPVISFSYKRVPSFI